MDATDAEVTIDKKAAANFAVEWVEKRANRTCLKLGQENHRELSISLDTPVPRINVSTSDCIDSLEKVTEQTASFNLHTSSAYQL